MRDSISKPTLADIARTLREARQAKHMSQRALSARSGATQAQISRIENGEVDLQVSSLIELARALDMDVILAPKSALPAVEALVRESERISRRSLQHAREDFAGVSDSARSAYTLDDEDDEED